MNARSCEGMVSVSQDHMQRPLFSEDGPRLEVLDASGNLVRRFYYGYRTGPMPSTVEHEAAGLAKKLKGAVRHAGAFA
jgi:hypothetical protein